MPIFLKKSKIFSRTQYERFTQVGTGLINSQMVGGIYCLVVMGGDLGRVFKSQYHLLDGHFSHCIVLKIVMFVFKIPKINEKEAVNGPFFIKKPRKWETSVFSATECRTLY